MEALLEKPSKYFITVDWCDRGLRGVFASRDGHSFTSPEQHTEDEMGYILGVFDLVLSPKSILITEEELKEYNIFMPLAEYSNQYGIVVKEKDYDAFFHGKEGKNVT